MKERAKHSPTQSTPSPKQSPPHTGRQVSPQIREMIDRIRATEKREENRQRVHKYIPQDLQKETHEVRQLLVTLHKSYQAFSFYPFNHPVVKQFSEHLYQALHQFFQHAPYLELRLDRFRILFYDEVVFQEQNVNNNFVYLLYSDGIRKLLFYKGLTIEECFRFFAILHQCSGERSLYDDVVTLMWEESFASIRYLLVEDLSTTFLPSFADDDDDEADSEGPTVRVSLTKAPPSNSQLAFRTIQQLSKTRLSLTAEETKQIDKLLFEEEQELMHRFLELMTLIITNHRESPELDQLIRVLQQLQPIIVSVGSIEDMLLCFRYLGHLLQNLSQRGSQRAKMWCHTLLNVLPAAYSEQAIHRLVMTLEDTPEDKHVQTIVSQYVLFIRPPSPERLLLAFDFLDSKAGRHLWCRTLAHKYKQAPRKLMPGIQTSKNKVVLGTCTTLGMIGNEDGWPLLERASLHKDKEIRVQALRSMLQLEATRLTTSKLLPLIEKYLSEADKELRKVALSGMIELGPNALYIIEKLFEFNTYEDWEQDEIIHLFHHIAKLCNHYPSIAEQVTQLLLQQYNGRFQSKQKQKIPRIILQALQREDTPQTAQMIEHIYQHAAKPLKRTCEELFHL